jgi:hypothetical protein
MDLAVAKWRQFGGFKTGQCPIVILVGIDPAGDQQPTTWKGGGEVLYRTDYLATPLTALFAVP